MAQIDKIIIQFEVRGGKEAQMIMAAMSRTLGQMSGASKKSGVAMFGLSQAVGIGSTSINNFGNQTQNTILKISEFAVVIFALIGAYKALVSPVVDVQKNMKTVEAVSHATRLELKSLQDEALRLGTIFPGGASKATAALVAIGQAGYDTAQSLQLLEPVFKLATIGEVEFDRGVKLTIATLNAFNLSTAESGRIVDVLASSISHTLTEFETFEITLPKLSALANILGVSFEELVGLVGFLTDRGLAASKVYTAITAMFTQLQKQTLGVKQKLKDAGIAAENFDIAGRGLSAVLMTVSKASLSASEKLELLGIRGVTAGSLLEGTGDVVKEMSEALMESGEASFQSSTMLGSVTAKWRQLIGTLDAGLNKAFAPVLEWIEKALSALAKFIRVLTNLDPKLQEWLRWITLLALGLTALSLVVRANILLVGFMVGSFTKVIVAVKAAVLGLAILRKTYTGVTLEAAAATAAVTAFRIAVGGIIGLAVTIGLLTWAWIAYNKSMQGALDTANESVNELRRQKEELEGLTKRLDNAAKEFEELGKAGKNTTKPLGEFYTVILDIIEKYPEMSRFLLGITTDFGNFSFAIGGANSVLDGLNSRLNDAIQLLAELEKKKFIIALGDLTEGATQEREFGLFETGRATPRPGMRKPRIPYDPVRGFIDKVSGPSAGATDIFAPETRVSRGDLSSDTQVFDAILGLTLNGIDQFSEHLAQAGVSNENILKIEEAIISQQVLALRESLKPYIPPGGGGGGGGDGDGGGKPPTYKVPDLGRSGLAFRKAESTLSEAELSEKLTRSGKSRLDIENKVLRLRKENVQFLIGEYGFVIASLQSEKESLDNEKDKEKVQKIISGLQLARLGLLTQELQVTQKIKENFDKGFIQAFEDLKDKLVPVVDFMKEIFGQMGEIADISQELETIGILGMGRGDTSLEIAAEQLSSVESKLGEIYRLRVKLENFVDKYGGLIPLWQRGVIAAALPLLDKMIKFLQDLRDELDGVVDLGEIREGLQTSFESSLSSALQSGTVKSAIDVFADAIKKSVADRLATIFTEKFLGGFLDKLANIESETKDIRSGASAGGTGDIGALGWVGIAMLAFSFFDGLFGGGKKMDEIDTKLDYVLRGAGYQLPPSFLLPEGLGEYSIRRQGGNSLALQFPRQGISLNITHRFEWSPSELAKAVGSDLSVSSMAGSKQFSNTDG